MLSVFSRRLEIVQCAGQTKEEWGNGSF